MKPRRVLIAAGICLCLVTVLGCIRLMHRYHQVRADQKLIAAIEAGNGGEVDSLLAAGADPNTRAVPHKQKPFLQLIRELLRPPPPSSQARTALIVALHDSDGEPRPNTFRIVRSLIAAGADVNARCNGSDTPLQLAAQAGRIDCVRALIGAGADVKGRGDCLCDLIQLDSPECIRLMIAAGVDVNAQTPTSTLPLNAAADYGFQDCLKELIAAGADLNAMDDTGVTALTLATEHGYAKCVKMLIAAGANVNVRDSGGTTALMWANGNPDSGEGSLACAKILVNAGADVDAKDSGGMTALDYAKTNNRPDIVSVLRKARTNRRAFPRGHVARTYNR